MSFNQIKSLDEDITVTVSVTKVTKGREWPVPDAMKGWADGIIKEGKNEGRNQLVRICSCRNLPLNSLYTYNSLNQFIGNVLEVF